MDFNINVAVVVAWVTAISTIVTTGAVTYRTIVRYLDRYLEKKLTPIIEWSKKQQKDIEAAAERDALIMETQLASLEAIHESKNNGNVSKAIDKLRHYMLKHSNRPSSYAKE